MSLQNRTALVTGSTSGIGLGIARSLAAEGCNLILHGLATPELADALQGEFKALGVQVRFDGADLRSVEQVQALVAGCGDVDILVNNAGIQHTAPVEEFPVDKWDQILAINLSSAFHTTRGLLAGMRQRGWGRIINLASVHGLVGSVHKAAYVAAKHGLIGLTKVVALETAGSGITCNAICPGWVLTPLIQAQIEARAQREGVTIEQAGESLLQEKQPSLQFVQTEQLGALAVFLCSEGGASMTGASLPIDGAWTAR
jgi:3-hydroxybutyrate dehydrogenase